MEDQLPVKEFPYPEQLFNEDGYPTEESLDYIRNWEISFKEGDAYIGIHFSKSEMQQQLLDYISSLWCWHDAFNQTEHYLELHTGGWSGNEEIIPYLKNTWFWISKWYLTITGGHYYFKLSDEGGKEIIKSLKE